MNRIPVVSSNVKSIGYDPEIKLLHVEFQSGKVYAYRGVPAEVYAAMMDPQAGLSIGQFVARKIVNQYETVPVPPPEPETVQIGSPDVT